MKRALFLFFIAFSVLSQAQCTMANYLSAFRIPSNGYPYTSVSSGVTVSVSTVNVPTLSDVPYTCGGNNYAGSSPAWWLNSATGIISFTFSAPVTNLTFLINGVNSTEVFYYTSNTGAITLSNFCTTGYTSVGGTLTAGATAGLGSIVTLSNPTGATQYTATHNGLGSGSRVTLLDCFLKIAPLPIELSAFKAQCRSNDLVELNWSTASELGNDYFTIEKSDDAQNFTEVGIVKGAGNSTVVRNYSYKDKNNANGVVYYRLKQTDITKNYKYSEIISVNSCREKGVGLVKVYPNPAMHEVTITSDTDGNVAELYNIVGVKLAEINLQRGENSLDLSPYSNGTYFIKSITTTGITSIQKLIVNR